MAYCLVIYVEPTVGQRFTGICYRYPFFNNYPGSENKSANYILPISERVFVLLVTMFHQVKDLKAYKHNIIMIFSHVI